MIAAFVAVACGGGQRDSKFAGEYVARGDQAASAQQWGEAMAAYDAALDESPNNAAIVEKRAQAAARWVEATAPKLASESPPEKAMALLDQLAREGKNRGAGAAVDAHVVPSLDGVVAKVWQPTTATEISEIWRSISDGEALTGSLPPTAGSRKSLEDLRQRAAVKLHELASSARHPGAVYLYAAMLARLQGTPVDGGATNGLEAISAMNWTLHVAPTAGCPELAGAFRDKLAETKQDYDGGGIGLPARIDVDVACVALARPTQRQEAKSWVETNLQTSQSCSTNVVQAEHARQVERYSRTTGQQVLISIEPRFENVTSCSSSVRAVKSTVTDAVTITVEERGYDARGLGAIAVAGKAYVLPISARSVWEKITTEGRLYGTREEQIIDNASLLKLAAHTLWIEIAHLQSKALEGVADDLVKQAGAAAGDTKLGLMVAALRISKRVKPEYVQFFTSALDIDKQQLAELVLGAAHVPPSMSATYKLEMPKVDRSVKRAVEQKKAAEGVDDFK